MKYLLSLWCFCCFAISAAQQIHDIDVKKGIADIVLRPQLGEIGVDIVYEFEVLQDVDSLYIDAGYIYHYEVYDKTFNGSHTYDKKRITFKNTFKKGEKHVVKIACFSRPKKAMYFIGWKDENAPIKQIWTQGQGKETSNWLPSFNDVNEKIEFDLSITFDKRYEVIANGELIKKEQPNDSLTKWYYNMKQPMSSYLVALAIGKYSKISKTAESGIPLDLYYYSKDSIASEPTYRFSKFMFDFLEEEIGVPYPWQNYKQIPVHDFLYAGMENTSATIFSDAYVVDSIGFHDKNYVNVNAHELAHQWFGDLVTAKNSKHHWLQEGFATYYALLVEKEIFDDDYFYWKLYESAIALRDLNDGKGEAVLNPKASSLTFYQRGAWTLFALRQKVGEKTFKKSVKQYLETYKFKTATTRDFINILEKESKEDLSVFVKSWLQDAKFPFDKAYELLKHNTMVDLYHSYVTSTNLEARKILTTQIESEINDGTYYPLQEILLASYTDKQTPEAIASFKKAFKTSDVKHRQAIAKLLREIPITLKEDYESLLDDESYITQELALLNLWINFPASRKQYLDKLNGTIGFNTKDIRIVWLTLALLTEDYKPEKSQEYYNELLGYTTATYNFETRQNAFEYLIWTKSCGAACIENLKDAKTHHNWRLAKFARKQLELLETN